MAIYDPWPAANGFVLVPIKTVPQVLAKSLVTKAVSAVSQVNKVEVQALRDIPDDLWRSAQDDSALLIHLSIYKPGLDAVGRSHNVYRVLFINGKVEALFNMVAADDASLSLGAYDGKKDSPYERQSLAGQIASLKTVLADIRAYNKKMGYTSIPSRAQGLQ